MAKALYGTLFDWIVLQVNHALAIKQSNVKEVTKNRTIYNINCRIFLCWPTFRAVTKVKGPRIRFLGN